MGLGLEVGDLTLEVEDLKSEVGERRSREIHPNLNPGVDQKAERFWRRRSWYWRRWARHAMTAGWVGVRQWSSDKQLSPLSAVIAWRYDSHHQLSTCRPTTVDNGLDWNFVVQHYQQRSDSLVVKFSEAITIQALSLPFVAKRRQCKARFLFKRTQRTQRNARIVRCVATLCCALQRVACVACDACVA